MKNISELTFNVFTAIIMIMTIMSCTPEPTSDCAELNKANVALASKLENYEAVWNEIVNNRNIDAINESSFDKNITLKSMPENIVGIEDFKAYYNNYLTGFSNVSFTIVDAFGQGDKIVKHWNFKGKHTGDFFGMPATNKDVNIDGVTLVKMKNGKIAQEQDFLDNMEFMRQLGQLKE